MSIPRKRLIFSDTFYCTPSVSLIPIQLGKYGQTAQVRSYLAVLPSGVADALQAPAGLRVAVSDGHQIDVLVALALLASAVRLQRVAEEAISAPEQRSFSGFTETQMT